MGVRKEYCFILNHDQQVDFRKEYAAYKRPEMSITGWYSTVLYLTAIRGWPDPICWCTSPWMAEEIVERYGLNFMAEKHGVTYYKFY